MEKDSSKTRQSTNMDRWTFAISFAGNYEFLYKTIKSIEEQKIPEYEIIVAYEDKINLNINNVKFIESGKEKKGWITKKKNDMIRNSTHNNICFMHDYIALGDGWYAAFKKFGGEWDVCSNRILNPFNNNARVADWMMLDHPYYGLTLIPYDVDFVSKYMLMIGFYFIAKKDFILKHNLFLDEKMFWPGTEDQEWSKRVRKLTNFVFNKNAVVYTLKDKRFGWSREIMKVDEMSGIEIPIRCIFRFFRSLYKMRFYLSKNRLLIINESGYESVKNIRPSNVIKKLYEWTAAYLNRD